MTSTSAAAFWETIACPVCGGTSFSPRFRLRFSEFASDLSKVNLKLIGCTPDTVFDYSECASCSFVTTNPRLTSSANETFYNSFKAPYTDNISTELGSPGSTVSSAHRTSKMIRTFRDLQLAIALCGRRVTGARRTDGPIRMLDYGSGHGYMLQLARTFGLEAAGVELSQSRIDLCRSMGLKVGSREEILDSKFDIVISQSVIEHVNDLNRYLQDIAGALDKGGIFICNGLTPQTVPIEQRRGRYKLTHPISHLNLMNRRNLQTLLEKHGFRIPGRRELWDRLREGSWSIYMRAPYAIYGAIMVDGADIQAIAIKT
ncbi:class I SAM-dependent methyltransferase [Ferrovibrio terrae]|nr:class I SAM-dependent methyltransferase [Ferrovibrio terrae]